MLYKFVFILNCDECMHSCIQVVVERHHHANKPLYFFILDCHAINDIDVSGQAAIESVYKMLFANNDILFIMTGVKYPVMKHLLRSHLLDLIGRHHFFNTVCVCFNFFFQIYHK